MKATSTIHPDDYYDTFLQRLNTAFLARCRGPIYTTDATGLWELYLSALPAARVQHYTCNACRRFVETFGHLAVLDASDGIVPLIWWCGDNGGEQHSALELLAAEVVKAHVTGVFHSSASVWGTPEAGGWHHMHVTPPLTSVWHHPLLTAHQAMAAQREDYKTLSMALVEVTVDQLAQTVFLLESNSLYRSEHVIAPARWLLQLKRDLAATKHHEAKRNRVWRAVATAPPGFCHPRTTMIGTLLADVASGLPFEACAARFAAKMHPLQYQRPQAAPSAGAVKRAERIVATLGIEPSLQRRYARVEEIITALWRAPQAKAPAAGGGSVFAGIATKGRRRGKKTLPRLQTPPPEPMTTTRFLRDILPVAQKLAVWLPSRPESYGALLTAVNPEAPPIIQWDREDHRNPFSWYVYSGGSRPAKWGLQTNSWCPVTAVCRGPHEWVEPSRYTQHGARLMLVLEGARDLSASEMCLFPEILSSKLHEVRSVIEAFSKRGAPAGADEASACGLILGATWSVPVRIRVWLDGFCREVWLERWE
jgi:hypothetical protein